MFVNYHMENISENVRTPRTIEVWEFRCFVLCCRVAMWARRRYNLTLINKAERLAIKKTIAVIDK